MISPRFGVALGARFTEKLVRVGHFEIRPGAVRRKPHRLLSSMAAIFGQSFSSKMLRPS
jgi:hypothetical protein